MNVIDVYDIANSVWYKQATSGTTPDIRVNPCAVVASAPDGSSFQVYMYGGQNLIPYGNQTQYDDMWILTIPSFTWIKVDTDGQSVPPARAGHTCNVWDSQMIVVGGYVGQSLSCDSPGVYVFDLSNLTWSNSFTALSDVKANPQSKEISSNKSDIGLSGSFGYRVPAAVQSIIGGNSDGGATVTAPVHSATDGPLSTGTPPTFAGQTVTATGPGVTTTATSPPSASSASSSSKSSRGNKTPIIIAAVLAGVFFLAASYFAFCAWIYRRQLALYRNHVSMLQHQAAGTYSSNPAGEKIGLIAPTNTHTSADGAGRSTNNGSGHQATPSTSSGTGSAAIDPQVYHSRYGREGDNDGASNMASVAGSSTDDLMTGLEPSYLGVLLNPRRSLRVVNRD
jgi:Kelch motif